jgi:hypothetical protein
MSCCHNDDDDDEERDSQSVSPFIDGKSEKKDDRNTVYEPQYFGACNIDDDRWQKIGAGTTSFVLWHANLASYYCPAATWAIHTVDKVRIQ